MGYNKFEEWIQCLECDSYEVDVWEFAGGDWS